MSKIAAIRIRGVTGVRGDIADTMDLLRLYRKNFCVVLESSPGVLGMVKKAKDYITYGELDDETYKLLVEKRGEPAPENPKYFAEHLGKKLKPFFRLSPPRGGFERGGIKYSFKEKGVLGYRGAAINSLIRRML